MSTDELRACLRCGLKRTVRTDRLAELCKDCVSVTAELRRMASTDVDAAKGVWRPHGLVAVFEPFEPDASRPRDGETYRWDDDELRLAHYHYNRGERCDWAREGERIYSREWRRRKNDKREQEAA